MVTLVSTISQQIARYLEKGGLEVRDIGYSYLNLYSTFTYTPT